MIRTIDNESARSTIEFCRSMKKKYLELCATGGGQVGHHRMMEPEDDAEMLKMYLQGYTRAEIARKIGCDDSTVTNRLKKMKAI